MITLIHQVPRKWSSMSHMANACIAMVYCIITVIFLNCSRIDLSNSTRASYLTASFSSSTYTLGFLSSLVTKHRPLWGQL